MARKNRWNWRNSDHGIGEVELFSWKYFHDFVCQEMLNYRHYIWRGQRCHDWLLECSLSV